MSDPIGLTAQEAAEALEEYDGTLRQSSFDSRWSGLEAFVIEQTAYETTIPAMDFHLFELCLEGRQTGATSYENTRGGPNTTWRPGAIFFAGAGQTGFIDVHGTCTNLQIALSRRVMDDVKAAMLRGDPDRVDLWSFNERYDPRLRACAEAIHRELVRPSAGGALVADAMAQALCVELVRGNPSGRPAPEPRRGRLSRAQLGRALDALEAGVPDTPGLDAVARAAGVSTAHFARAFKAATGRAPHQHLTERRLARAQEHLAHGTDPIAEIAYACGFASQSHMTALFTRHLGVTPARYRKERRG